MKLSVTAISTFTLAAVAGFAAGLFLRQYQSGGIAVDEHHANPPLRPAHRGNAGKFTPSDSWTRELAALDAGAYPAYSLAYHARFSEVAAVAIQSNPRAAMEAFAQAAELHRTGCVQIFAELLSRSQPLLLLELSDALPAVFTKTLQSQALSGLARLEPDKALELIRANTFSQFDADGLYMIFGSGAAGSGDVSRLTFLRSALKGAALESAVISFADSLAMTDPQAAVAAAAANPDISGRLTTSAGITFWKSGDVAAAFDCLAKADPSNKPRLVEDYINAMEIIPVDALLPAFRSLIEVAGEEGAVPPLRRMELLCMRVKDRLQRTEPSRMEEFARFIPEGTDRDEFLKK